MNPRSEFTFRTGFDMRLHLRVRFFLIMNNSMFLLPFPPLVTTGDIVGTCHRFLQVLKVPHDLLVEHAIVTFNFRVAFFFEHVLFLDGRNVTFLFIFLRFSVVLMLIDTLRLFYDLEYIRLLSSSRFSNRNLRISYRLIASKYIVKLTTQII